MKTLADLNADYLRVHTKKEDLFWTTYMGTEDDPDALKTAELEYKGFVSDPSNLAAAREALKAAKTERERNALQGWVQFFSANVIEGEQAAKLQQELIELESALFNARAQLKLSYRRGAEEVPASTVVLNTNITADPDEEVRRTSHEGLLKLEEWVLENGFLPLVAKRNEFARAQGFKDYFEYRVHKNERLSYGELFGVLQEFEALTRASCQALLKRIAGEKGPRAVLGHNIKFAAAGDAETRLDPFFPFARSLETWAKTFSRLGIRYRGAQLTLDLFDRKGKYENGFMHGPSPCFFDPSEGFQWRPSRIGFTSNATPTQVGSGRRALTTLFHEGGHAAHFSNITQDAPCFSMEYPPTSMAYAETQSMFCDSLVDDADWMKLYARDKDGGPIPDEIVRFALTLDHPFKVFQERQLLLVPVFESRLYKMSDAERTPASVRALARAAEKEVLGVECSPRPVLSVPHLLTGEAACSYQGYLLAHMAVYQTRSHFLKKYGYLADNPAVGTDLAEHYWNPGNSKSHDETLRSLTGVGLSGRPLAEHCNLSNEALWVHSQEQMRKAAGRKPLQDEPELDALLFIVHGKEEIASSRNGMKAMSEAFAAWVARWPRR